MEFRTQEGSKRLVWSLFFFLAIMAYPHPSNSFNLFKYHQVSMGTVVEITLVGEDEEASQ